MPKPYSMDLRERAVSRVMAGESVRSVAAVVQVSVSSVVKWSQRYRATGSAAPGRMGGYRPRVLLPHRDWLAARIASGEHFTLRGLQAELAERGIKVDYRTVWSFVPCRRAELQKKACCQASSTVLTSPGDARGGRGTRVGSILPGSSSLTRPGSRPTWRRSVARHHAAKGSMRMSRTVTGRP